MWAAPSTTKEWPDVTKLAIVSDMVGVEFGSFAPVMKSAGQVKDRKSASVGPFSCAKTV